MIKLLIRKVMGFLLMLSFFTRLPIGQYVVFSEERYKDGLWAFPLTGILTGMMLAVPAYLTRALPPLSKLLIIVVYLAVTGGIHLDGLADSADGIFSGRDKKRSLEIMKDSNIGAFGVIALILYFICFYEAAQIIDWRGFLLMPFVGKAMGTFVASFSIYARKEQGMGALFVGGMPKAVGLLYLCLAGMVSVIVLGKSVMVAYGVAFVVAVALAQKIRHTIDGQTGDTIGMIIEVSQMAFILTGGLTWG